MSTIKRIRRSAKRRAWWVAMFCLACSSSTEQSFLLIEADSGDELPESATRTDSEAATVDDAQDATLRIDAALDVQTNDAPEVDGGIDARGSDSDAPIDARPPSPDPCALPPDAISANVSDITGLCGFGGAVGSCGILDSTPHYFIVPANESCGACGWAAPGGGFRFGIPAGKCAKVTIQPGAWAHVGDYQSSTACSSQPDCIVVSTLRGGSMAQPGGIDAIGIQSPAWFRYENAPLENGTCPLTCP